MTIEWVLGIIGGYVSINGFVYKILSNRKEAKLLKQMEETTDKKLLPFDEKLKTHSKRISDFNIKVEKCITEIGDIKIFIAETKLNFKYIKEALEGLKKNSDKILEYTNRTRENGNYIKSKK